MDILFPKRVLNKKYIHIKIHEKSICFKFFQSQHKKHKKNPKFQGKLNQTKV